MAHRTSDKVGGGSGKDRTGNRRYRARRRFKGSGLQVIFS